MNYLPLNGLVSGLKFSLRNSTWPGTRVHIAPEVGDWQFTLHRRGCDPRDDLDFPTVLDCDSACVTFDERLQQLPRGYYEGWFHQGCNETPKVWFFLGEDIAFCTPQVTMKDCCTEPGMQGCAVPQTPQEPFTVDGCYPVVLPPAYQAIGKTEDGGLVFKLVPSGTQVATPPEGDSFCGCKQTELA